MSRCLLSLAVAGFSFVALADVPYVRTESRAAVPGTRARAFERTRVWAEWEPYGPSQNMMHRYTDRQLFMDIRDREVINFWPYFGDITRDANIAHTTCGLDGLAPLDYFSWTTHAFERFEQSAPDAGYSHFIVLPGDCNEARYPSLKAMILKSAKSKWVAKHDGKLIFWNYGGGPEGQRWLAKRLRSDPEIPPFLFVGEMPFMVMYNAYSKYVHQQKVPVPAAEVESFKQLLNDYLKDFDGFNVWCTHLEWDHIGELPTRSVATPIYRDYLLPCVLEVVNRPENKGKLLGTWLRQGYVNPFAGVTDGEYGTETLRNYLNESILLHPDLWICFEWNEANENTHFQPTVAHGKAFTRVINYYKSLNDGTPPKPMNGDDLTIPNLVVSVRQAIKLGEPWHCELLYLPDSAKPKEFTAQLTLRGSDGTVLRKFPSEKIKTGDLLAIDYRVDSQYLGKQDSLSVELETVYDGKRQAWTGFDSTRIRATACRDYLYSNMPLREQLVPVKEPTFTVAATENERVYSVSGTLDAGEPLSSLEVVDDLEEVATCDLKNVFDRSKYAIFRGEFTALISELFGVNAEKIKQAKFTFVGAPHTQLRPKRGPWEGFVVAQELGQGRFRTQVTMGGKSAFFALVPLNELKGAKLLVESGTFGNYEASLEEVWNQGVLAINGEKTVRLELNREDKLPDYAVPILKNAATVTATCRSDKRVPAYQLRAVTMSGKIWRSRLVHPLVHDPETKTISIFSDLAKAPATTETYADAIPDIKYRFQPKFGGWLRNSFAAVYDAKIGGGGNYGEPMSGAKRMGRLPDDFVRPDPTWTNIDEKACLRFEKGSFLQLPHETVPRGAPYTFAFEIMPDDASDQVLVRSRDVGDGDCGLQVWIAGGTLHITHFGILYYRFPDLDSGFKVKPGEWNKIAIAKDFMKIRVIVNGEIKDFPYDRRARKFSGIAFGGNVAPGKNLPEGIRPFTGFLRAMRIRHEFPKGK